MGACISKFRADDLCAASTTEGKADAGQIKAADAGADSSDTPSDAAADGAQAPRCPCAKPTVVAHSSPSSALPSNIMRKAREVMQDLASIAADGSRGSFCEACEVLLQRMQADLAHVSIIAYTSSYEAHIMAGAAGVQSEQLQQQLLMIGPQWSAARCSPDSGMQPLYITVTDSSQADCLPQDWMQLYTSAGLSTFLAVPVNSAGGMPLGLLVLAGQQPKAFMEDWWGPLLSIVCTSVVPLLSCPLMMGLCSLAGTINGNAGQLYTQCELFLKGASSLLETVTNIRLHVRLGLISPDGEEVLLLQQTSKQGMLQGDGFSIIGSMDDDSSLGVSCCSSEQQMQLSVVRLPASETMLMESVAYREPRHLLDVTKEYLEDNTRIAADVVIDANAARSLVVMPLFANEDTPFGGIYVTHSKPSWFEESRGAIIALAGLLQAMLDEHVMQQPRQEEWRHMCREITLPSSSGVSSSFVSQSGTHGSSCRTGPLLNGVSGCILQAVQQELLELRETPSQREHNEEDIQLQRMLGVGGFGVVYDGRWKGCRAAIKVMFVPDNLRRQMKLALEMATLATISHPNIVRVYSCIPDMVEESRSARQGRAAKPHDIFFRAAEPEDYANGVPTCNLMVMEVCEGGNLLNAISKGLLHSRMPDGRLVVNTPLLLGVLLDVAYAIQHLHSLKLMHCDIKPENILLQQCSSSTVKGFVAKLSDFGLMKAMHSDTLALFNKSVSGTLTHLAPERLVAGALLTPAVDVWAFGMIMYEAFTGQRPFAGMRPAAVVARISSGGKPEFPQGSPPLYQKLAEACWAHDAGMRPTMAQITQLLHDWLGTLIAVQSYAGSMQQQLQLQQRTPQQQQQPVASEEQQQFPVPLEEQLQARLKQLQQQALVQQQQQQQQIMVVPPQADESSSAATNACVPQQA